jgi:hypothetical protein
MNDAADAAYACLLRLRMSNINITSWNKWVIHTKRTIDWKTGGKLALRA